MCLLQETPETISVYGLSSRTTSALEAYNGVLGKTIQSKGAFFKFVSAIRSEEFIKQRDLVQLIDSGGASSSNNRKRVTKDRYARIEEALELFTKNKLTLVLLINRLTCPANKNVSKMDDFGEYPADDFSASSEDEEQEEEERRLISMPAHVPVCLICKDAWPNVFQIPCGHVKLCKGCYDQLEALAVADNDLPQCPECRSEITEIKTAFI